MQNNAQTRRYDRQMKLPEIGSVGQERLRRAKVLIVGVGGLGCPVAQYLVAAGVGTIGLLDHDLVDISNLHRQILFRESDVGQPKAVVAKAALQQLNGPAQICSYVEALTTDNAVAYIRDYDLVIDGTDNFQTKYLINDACLLADKPWVYASLYKFQGQLSVFNYQGGPTYRCLFPATPAEDVSCEAMGVLGVLPGILGTLQAAEALKIMLQIGTVLSGKLKVIDALTGQEQCMAFARNEAEVQRILERGLEAETIHCTLPATDGMYLDVREWFEQPRLSGEQVLRIPLNQLEDRHGEIPTDQPVYVYCQSGKRSQEAIRFLSERHRFDNLINVAGGIQSMLK